MKLTKEQFEQLQDLKDKINNEVDGLEELKQKIDEAIIQLEDIPFEIDNIGEEYDADEDFNVDCLEGLVEYIDGGKSDVDVKIFSDGEMVELQRDLENFND